MNKEKIGDERLVEIGELVDFFSLICREYTVDRDEALVFLQMLVSKNIVKHCNDPIEGIDTFCKHVKCEITRDPSLLVYEEKNE